MIWGVIMNISLRAMALGVAALCVAGSCPASIFSDAVKQAAGVNVRLASQVAQVVQTPPKTVEVPRPAVSPAPPQTVAVVTPTQRDTLLKSIDELSQSSAHNAAKIGSIVLGLVIGAIALGLLASLAGFCKWSTAAGVLSILATATVGANNALPFRSEADNYKYVSAEASALLTRAKLDLQMTPEVYNKYAEQLLKLATYGDGTSTAGSAGDLEKLLQDLHAAGGPT
jgi:hypothetical protein